MWLGRRLDSGVLFVALTLVGAGCSDDAATSSTSSTAQSPTTTAVLGSLPRIAFSSAQDGNSEIYVMQPDGCGADRVAGAKWRRMNRFSVFDVDDQADRIDIRSSHEGLVAGDVDPKDPFSAPATLSS